MSRGMIVMKRIGTTRVIKKKKMSRNFRDVLKMMIMMKMMST